MAGFGSGFTARVQIRDRILLFGHWFLPRLLGLLVSLA
jgi:hypothetical protein